MTKQTNKEPDKLDETGERDEKGRFVEGHEGIGGRPRGFNPLKDYQRELFDKMSEDEKKKFLKEIGAFDKWKMAEGNPHQTSDMDVKSDGEKIIGIAVHLPKDEGKNS